MKYWSRIQKFDPRGAALADRHYSRRTIGSPQFMPPGQTIVLLTADEKALFGWWRPDPASGIKAMNGLDGWTCSIFRNEGTQRSSELILDAELAIAEFKYDCGPSGFITYVWDKKVRSINPGCCFKRAGWAVMGRSADNKKDIVTETFFICRSYMAMTSSMGHYPHDVPRRRKPFKRQRGLDVELKALGCPPRTTEVILPVERIGMVWTDRGWKRK